MAFQVTPELQPFRPSWRTVVGVMGNAQAREVLQGVPGLVQLLEDTSSADPDSGYWIVTANDDQVEAALMTLYRGNPVWLRAEAVPL